MTDEPDIIRPRVRCFLGGHSFDFYNDLGAVEMPNGTAACTPCLNKLFWVAPKPADGRTGSQGNQPYKRNGSGSRARLIGSR